MARLTVVLCWAAVLLLAGCGGGDHPLAKTRPATRRPAEPPTRVVMIKTNVKPLQGGTGWVYDARRGLVVTAFHVTNGVSSVQLKAGARPWRRATVVAAAPCEDVALLKVRDTNGLATLPMGSVSRLRKGRRVTGQGFASSATLRIWRSKRGVIRQPRVGLGPSVRALAYPPLGDLLQTTAVSSPGMSGGPILDDRGRLGAMVYAQWTPARGAAETTLAVRVDRIRAALAEFARGDAPGWIGSGVYFPARGVASLGGMVVTGLGLRGGYGPGGVLVTKVNGAPVGDSFTSWCRTGARLPAGELMLTLRPRPHAPILRLRVDANRARPLP